MLNNLFALKVLLIVLLSLLPNFWIFSETHNAKVKAAALLPLTGSAAEQGAWILAGLKLGVLEAKKKFSADISITLEDTAADPKQAINAYKKIQSSDAVSIVFTYGSGVGVALSPVANKDKVVQIGLATATPAYRSANDYNLRNFPDAELDSQFIIDISKKHFQNAKVAILYINNEFGSGAAAAFKKKWLEGRGEIVYEDSVEPGATDLRSQLLKLKSKEPTLIYLALYPAEGAIILRQSYEIGIKAKKIASVAILGGRNFFELAGKGAEGLLIASSTPVFMESTEMEVKDFVSRYKITYNEEPGLQHIYAARAYDAAMLIGELSVACGNDATCFKEKLHQTKNYHGAGGTFSFDENGDIESSFTLQEISNGTFRTPDFLKTEKETK